MYMNVRLGNLFIFEVSGLILSLRLGVLDLLLDLHKEPVTYRFICERVPMGAAF